MKAGGKSDAKLNFVLFGFFAYIGEPLQGFAHAAIQVFAIEGLTCGNDELEVTDTGGDRPFVSLQIWNQSGKLDAREPVELRGHSFRIRQLRDPLGVNETGSLNALDAGSDELLDQS
jgi:hypothetical protein